MSPAIETAATVAGIEIGKAILIVLIQELLKRGLTSDQLDSLYLNTKVQFMANNPDNIPEAK